MTVVTGATVTGGGVVTGGVVPPDPDPDPHPPEALTGRGVSSIISTCGVSVAITDAVTEPPF